MIIQNSRRRVRAFGWLAGFALMSYAAGCSSIAPLGHVEPKVIIVRNSSGTALSQVEIFELKKLSGKGGRFGSVSPVPEGVSQMLIRGTSPPPFPGVVGVRWTDNSGGEFHEEVSIKKTAPKLTEPADMSLVFEILAAGRVRAYFEPYR